MRREGRIAAALIAACAWAGLGIEFVALLGEGRSVAQALWVLLAFFTIATNLAVAVLFSIVALGREGPRQEARLAGLTVTIVLVGIVYAALLRGTVELHGARLVGDYLVHVATPILALVFWLVFVPKGRLRTGDPIRWTVLPLLYLGYYFVRGGLTGTYSYPFMDPPRNGWSSALTGMLGCAALFLILGTLVLVLDRWLGRARRRMVSTVLPD